MGPVNVIEDQLKKVEYADLSNFNKETMSGIIPKRSDIKISEDDCYLIQIHRSFFSNQTVALNWNKGSFPPSEYLKIDVSKKVGKMINVVGVSYDPVSNNDTGIFWNGWLSTEEISVLSKL